MGKTILITGIGGNVGQGILRNIKALHYDLRVIGCNIDLVSAGNHLCEKVYKVPYAYDAGYIDSILHICQEENVDLIIPSTDFEALYLSQQISRLPAVATNDSLTNEVFTDKYKTWVEFNRLEIPFATSFLPSKYDNRFKNTVLKPRMGRGSRGVIFNPPSVAGFNDDEYMVQECVKGIEITTAFYVNQKNENVGSLTFERSLANGATNICKVSHEYKLATDNIIDKLIRNFKIRGACNIQSIYDGKNVIPFEINGRISGTNSIRAQLGFNDVKFTIDEYLFNRKIETPQIKNGVAVRMLVDVIYPDAADYSAIENCSTKNFVF